MDWSNVFIVFGKEMRDALRDRRTLVSMIVVPTLLLPLLLFGTVVVATRIVTKARAEPLAVAIVGGEDSPELVQALRADAKFTVVPPPRQLEQAIADKRLRGAVEIPPGFAAALERGERPKLRLLHYEGELRSAMAVDALEGLLRGYRDRLVERRLAAHGLSADAIKPFTVERKNVAPAEKIGGNWAGGVLAYMIILLCFTGAMYPALDLTAGEKERGTLETLLCSPASRLAIVLGKFLVVLAASLATMLLALVSTGTSLVLGGVWLSRFGGGLAAARAAAGGALPTIDPLGLLGVFAMVLPVAVLFSAAQFALALLAKSYKEAQSYVSPLILVVVLPAAAGMLPGVELNARLALVPLLNLSLVCRELLSGVWHWSYLALIFGSSALYAAAALAAAVALFKREAVLFRT